MKNIDFFNIFALALLEKLYGEFPNPIEIDTNNLGVSLIPEDCSEEIIHNLLNSTDNAVTFLAEEGFITYKSAYLGGGFSQVRLTAKGLAVLNSTPEAIDSREPLIARIRKAFAGGAKEAATETVKRQ